MNYSKGKFFKNMSWLMGGKIVNMLLQFFVSLATARYLGPSNFGTINYVAAYVSFFSSVASLGLAVIVIRDIASGGQDENKIIWTSIFMRLATAFLSTISLLTLMFITHPGNTTILVIALLESIAIIFSAFDTINYWFQAKLLSKYTTIATTLAYIGMSLYRIYLLARNADIEAFAFATSIEYIFLAIFLMTFYIRKAGFHPCFSIKMSKKLFKNSYYYMIAGLITILYSQMDKIMIGQMMDDSAVGLYAAALSITTLWSFVPTAFLQSATPVLFSTAKNNKPKFMHRLRQVYAGILWMNILYSLSVTVFADFIIRILYGTDYLGAKGALIIAVWYYGISSLSAATQVYLSTEGKDKYINYFCIVGMIVNFVLNFILIPIIGINGAAIATLITHAIIQIIMPLACKETREVGVLILEAFILKDVYDDTIKEAIHKIKLKRQSLLSQKK